MKERLLKSLDLESGQVLPQCSLAYETYGRLAPGGANAILVTHGFTSSHHAAGPSAPGDPPGWWDGLIGPGRTIDTDRYFVVSSNMLGGADWAKWAPALAEFLAGLPR
jgi:homoserine O-acetyltransferase